MIRNKPVLPESFKKIKNLPETFKTFGVVEFAYLFGSSTKGVPKPLADIDLAVYFEEDCDFQKSKLSLLGEVNDLLNTDEIDLVVLNTAPISIVGRILLQKELLFCKNDFLRHDFESLPLRKFYDFSLYEERLLTRRFGVGRSDSHHLR